MHRSVHLFTATMMVLFVITSVGHAERLDGNEPLACVADKGIEYRNPGSSKDFDPESVGLPANFIVDFKNKKIEPTKESLVRRTTKIYQTKYIEDKLILQGADEGVEGVVDGIGWSMAISKDTGRFVISASGTSVGYIVFGNCKCVKQNSWE